MTGGALLRVMLGFPSTGGLHLATLPTEAWRDSAARFIRFRADDIMARRLTRWSDDALRLLRVASPVRTGALKAGWQAQIYPQSKRVEITNTQAYTSYVILGTRYMAPNPALGSVLDYLGNNTRLVVDDIGHATIRYLKGG